MIVLYKVQHPSSMGNTIVKKNKARSQKRYIDVGVQKNHVSFHRVPRRMPEDQSKCTLSISSLHRGFRDDDKEGLKCSFIPNLVIQGSAIAYELAIAAAGAYQQWPDSYCFVCGLCQDVERQPRQGLNALSKDTGRWFGPLVQVGLVDFSQMIKLRYRHCLIPPMWLALFRRRPCGRTKGYSGAEKQRNPMIRSALLGISKGRLPYRCKTS
jgi:hypothetical protein